MNASTLRQRLTGFLATVAVLGIVIGLPVMFFAIGANPIPEQPPTFDAIKDALTAPDDGTLGLGLFKVVAWVGWAFMALSLALEVIARLRTVEAPKLPGLRLPQAGARGLIGLAALLFVAAPLTAQATSAPSYAAPDQAAVGHNHTSVADYPVTTDTVTDLAKPDTKRQRTISHTVRTRESLWSIAEAKLDDGTRWKEIQALNRDLLGDRPGFLEPGWVLELPAPANKDVLGHRYPVQPGDTLSDIAQTELDDADRWPEIYDASTRITQPGGAHLTDPDDIVVGWTLTIPGTQAPAGMPTGPAEPKHPKPPVVPPATENVRPPTEIVPADPESEAPSPTADADPTEEGTDSVLNAPWVLAGLTGGGVLLSGALLMALSARRRTAARYRRPGRTVAPPPQELAPVEMTLAATGTRGASTVEFTHEALLRLAAAVGAVGGTMPPVVAVELGHELTLHLSAPAELPAPWVGSPDQTHWHVSTGIDAVDLGPDTEYVESPYPLLVTIGASDTGQTWLLNCEELSTLTITGDPTYRRDFARHVAAQLAVNPWSHRVQLACIGVAEETVVMDERLTYHPTGAAGMLATAEILAAAVATVDRATRHDTDASTARTGSVDDDAWPARMLLLDTAVGEPADFTSLVQLVNDNVGRSATSIVIAGQPTESSGAVLHLTNTGRVILEHAGLNLLAVGLTSDEARGCALIYAQSDTVEDVSVPVDETAVDGLEAFMDRSGALREEYTLPRNTSEAAVDEPLTSLLERDDEDYLREAAVVQRDLETLAPKVDAHVRAEIESKDADLDQDITDWFSPTCDRPRLSLLGPVMARTRGKALVKRKPYFTELLAFLALHRKNGATREQICDAFAIEAGKARDYAKTVRDWLGLNPRTGEPHLPHADQAPATQSTGVNVYQVDDGLLVDLHLFIRLRARGQARGGTDGIADLCKALELVGTERPLSHLRENGWSWIANERDRIDLMAPGWIADVALIVVTEALVAKDLAQARFAASVANVADPDGESARLCLAHVSKAEGNEFEAERILREDVCNRADDGDPPLELSERTKTIIRSHGWLAS